MLVRLALTLCVVVTFFGSASIASATDRARLDQMIAHYANVYGIPEDLFRRVVHRESRFNPAARNGPYWGLMQIRHDTARTMGYRGSAEGLLDAETNLIFAGRYLRGAYIVANGNHDRAVRHYAAGYYYHARDKGLLEETALRKGPRTPPLPVAAFAAGGQPTAVAAAPQPTPTFAPPVQASVLGFAPPQRPAALGDPSAVTVAPNLGEARPARTLFEALGIQSAAVPQAQPAPQAPSAPVTAPVPVEMDPGFAPIPRPAGL